MNHFINVINVNISGPYLMGDLLVLRCEAQGGRPVPQVMNTRCEGGRGVTSPKHLRGE